MNVLDFYRIKTVYNLSCVTHLVIEACIDSIRAVLTVSR